MALSVDQKKCSVLLRRMQRGSVCGLFIMQTCRVLKRRAQSGTCPSRTSMVSEQVYSPEGIAVLEDTRVVLDLTTMAKKLKEYESRPIKIAATGFKGFKTAVDRVPVTSLSDVPEAELKQQFRTFLRRLSEMTARMSPEEMAKTDTKDL